MKILEYMKSIEKHAKEHGLEPSLVAAICMQESSGDPFAHRFEAEWRYYKDIDSFARKCRITADTERAAQAFSYGLMQIMGSVAREKGFSEALPKLFDIDTNLRFGCMHLAGFLKKYNQNMDQAIASYNAGSPRLSLAADGKYVNQYYVDRVLAFKRAIEGTYPPKGG